MSIIFWGLLIIAGALAGALIFRISIGARRYRSGEFRQSASDVTAELMSAEIDLALLRWLCVFIALTVGWGAVEFVIRLIS